MLLVVALVFTLDAADNPFMLVGAAPLLVGVAAVSLTMWRLGVFGCPDGVLIQGAFGRTMLPWSSVETARVEDAAVGLRPQRTVVISSQQGQSHRLYLWNERSLLMRGSAGGVDALAARINEAVERHRA
jgi:hypothetical protein